VHPPYTFFCVYRKKGRKRKGGGKSAATIYAGFVRGKKGGKQCAYVFCSRLISSVVWAAGGEEEEYLPPWPARKEKGKEGEKKKRLSRLKEEKGKKKGRAPLLICDHRGKRERGKKKRRGGEGNFHASLRHKKKIATGNDPLAKEKEKERERGKRELNLVLRKKRKDEFWSLHLCREEWGRGGKKGREERKAKILKNEETRGGERHAPCRALSIHLTEKGRGKKERKGGVPGGT